MVIFNSINDAYVLRKGEHQNNLRGFLIGYRRTKFPFYNRNFLTLKNLISEKIVDTFFYRQFSGGNSFSRSLEKYTFIKNRLYIKLDVYSRV